MEDNEQRNDTIKINVPLRIDLCDKRSEREKAFIAMEHLEIRADFLFRQINAMSFLSQNGGVKEVAALETSDVLGELGSALLEALTIEREKLGKLLSQNKTKGETKQ